MLGRDMLGQRVNLKCKCCEFVSCTNLKSAIDEKGNGASLYKAMVCGACYWHNRRQDLLVSNNWLVFNFMYGIIY